MCEREVREKVGVLTTIREKSRNSLGNLILVLGINPVLLSAQLPSSVTINV